MYLEEIAGKSLDDLVKIKYDCTGKFKLCGQEKTITLGWAENNFARNGGKHICRSCVLSANNPMKKQENKEKVKKTCLEKYGTAMPINSKENIESRVQQMFGSEESTQKIVAKRKATSRKRYGSDHIMQTEEGVKRLKKAMQEKYGVDHPYQSQEILDKMKENNLKKYGVENVASLPEVRIKMAEATLKKYGVEHYNQLPEMKEYLRENCSQWLKESWANGGPMKGIVRPEEWNQKQRETVCLRIQSGNWNGGFQSNCRGRYLAKKCRKQNPRFLSSLELKMHYFLDTNPNVEWYDYECLSIPYTKKEGTQHLYFPDFLVKFIDDPIEHIIETKTWKEKDSINVQIKQEAGINYATEHNMTYTIMFDEDVDQLNLDLEFLKNLPQVELI